VSVYVCVIE